MCIQNFADLLKLQRERRGAIFRKEPLGEESNMVLRPSRLAKQLKDQFGVRLFF